MKLVALYKQPLDAAAFDQYYTETHTPLVQKMPGLRQLKITRFPRTLMGDGYYMMAEMYFDDRDALNQALRSPEGAATAGDLQNFAAGLCTLMIGQEE